MKLSRPAWNNVLIVATLLMILAFNGVHKKLLSNAEQADGYLPLLPEQSLLLTLDFGHTKLERIGRTWRAVNGQQATKPLLSQEQIDKTVQTWRSAVAQPLTSEQLSDYRETLASSPWVVIVWLAGEEQGQIYQLYLGQRDLIIRHKQQVLWLPTATFSELIPHA